MSPPDVTKDVLFMLITVPDTHDAGVSFMNVPVPLSKLNMYLSGSVSVGVILKNMVSVEAVNSDPVVRLLDHVGAGKSVVPYVDAPVTVLYTVIISIAITIMNSAM